MKLKDVLDKSIQFFKDKKMDSPRLDAELLIAHALKIERMQLYLKYESPLSESEVSLCREAIRRRSLGEPVAYITEEKGFFGQIFKVGAGVLIPRPETEHLVEQALDFIKEKKIETPKILDLGAGTGCVGFSILKNHPAATLTSIEKSETAFKYLKQNCENLNLNERAQLFFADINNSNILNETEKFDIILANPPYIDKQDSAVELMVKKFEPSEALFAEQNGFQLLKNWSQRFTSYLNSPGLLAFEMGSTQGQEMLKHLQSLILFSSVQIIKDLSGLDRIIKGVR